MKKIVIIGAGLASMSAGVHLSDAGHEVTILEANPFIGGRTSSWDEDGMEVESGLHRFLGFYTALPDLIKKVGVDLDEIVTWEDEVEIRVPNGPRATLGLAPLHKPLKTAWAALGHNDLLPPSEKLAVGIMFGAGLKDYFESPEELDQITVADYARKHGVSDKVIRTVLTALTDGIFFVPPDEYSMHNLMGIFAPYIKSMAKLRVGAFNGGMTNVLMQPMAEYIERRKGVIKTGTLVKKLVIEKNKVVGVETNNGNFKADYVILAASLFNAQKLIHEAFTNDPFFADMLKLKTTPSVTFQMDLKRPSMEVDRTTFGPGTIMASFTEQSRTTFPGTGRLSVILSNPEKYQKVAAGKILKIIIKDAQKLGVDLEGNVERYRKIVIPHDFYSLRTGSEKLRPKQQTNIPNFFLAGDYTKQPYLATMEGAVYSGKLAAELITLNS